MVKESVLLDISADSSHPNGLEKVTAEFQMRNLGDVPEIMDVRFPLNWDMAQYRLNLSDEECYTGFPAIDDFSVTVNGLQEDITMTGRTEPTNDQGTPEPALLPCWAYFIVTFLPKQDVTITVSYTVKGYLDNGISQVAFYYVLTTRAGWKDTIGTADITVRFPYPINDMNFLGGTEGWLSAGGREVK